MSFLLGNGYRLEESGVDMSTPVHPVAPPLVKMIFLDLSYEKSSAAIDLLAILQKSLDRALFLCIFIHEARLSGVKTFY